MNRARPVEAALAALATVAVTLPVLTLFTPSTWVRPAVVLVAVVAVSGVALRRHLRSETAVVAGQVLALWVAIGLLHGRGHLRGGLFPAGEAVRAYDVLLSEAIATVSAHSAPAPTTRGVSLGIGLLIALTALVVDAVAVTHRAPAAAGMPLLTAYLASASNSGSGLAAGYFVPAAITWLALVGHAGVASLRRWSTSTTTEASASRWNDPLGSLSTVGRLLGVLAVVAAVILPAAAPSLPTTFLADGLGRSDDARGSGLGGVQLSTSVDIARSLGDRSDAVVLEYRTRDTKVVPLKVAALDTYVDGLWSEANVTGGGGFSDVVSLPRPLSDVARRRGSIEVLDNRLRVPQVALPIGFVPTSFPLGSWSQTPSGNIRLTSPLHTYVAPYIELLPTVEQFAGEPTSGFRIPEDLEVDPGSTSAVEALLNEITAPADSHLEVARKIQAHLRSSAYIYDLSLAEAEAEDGDRTPIERFLTTKRGYCVQFASTMVMMARAAGIPARMVVGFLPGTLEDGRYVVRAQDAHAWPELYFEELGWVRFEPTPGQRSGVAPAYSLAPSEVAPSASPSASASSAPTPTRSARPDLQEDPTDLPATSPVRRGSQWLSDHAVGIGSTLLLVLAATALPLGAALRTRRARRRAADDAARTEVEWEQLVLRLADLGVESSAGATPRQAHAQITALAVLPTEPREALARVVGTLEIARYAAPGPPIEDVAEDAALVWRSARKARSRATRIRALLLPTAGRLHWSEASSRIRDRLGRGSDQSR